MTFAKGRARATTCNCWLVCVLDHSNQRRITRADGSARYVDGTRRLPISPLIDTYLVPEAPQGA
eukprot:1421359-Prymnesium_polylepis.1